MLEQLDLLGEEVVPVLRREFAALKPAHVPDAPTHASLLAARDAASLVDPAGDSSVVEPASDPSVVEPASAASGVETQGAHS